ncbi:MAG: 23S rRNA (pseudouridine(1915)-N(3))-methyltransferase RlmH [Bacteroidales bacterium]|nr:MAG: 23S rRNA (pseudouridine(1915)-N(3))-methyltransferase RlmH [Bacteroidales bacterium]
MKVTLIVVGKTDKKHILEGVSEYEKRLSHYCKFEVRVISDIKNSKSMSASVQVQKEGELILGVLRSKSEVILLDERGSEFSSIDFAKFIEKKGIAGQRELTFIIGGPYGFSPEVKAVATALISLSRLTFSHQIVRLIFMEQLYRAMTIIKGEPYHHE